MSEDLVFLRDSRHPEGSFLRQCDALISPSDRGFLFGDGVYEVIRAYGGRLFGLDGHMSRLSRSLRAVQIEAADVEAIIAAMSRLLASVNRSDATVYIQVTRGEAPRSHAFPCPAVPPTLFMSVSEPKEYASQQQEGISVVTLSDFRWSRCDVKTIALQANVLALQHARDRDAEECVFVRDGVVTEGTHTNVFGVLDGIVRTHPATNHILAGITRSGVLGLCRMDGVPIQESAIVESDLCRLDEAFLTATSCEVTPIVRINGHTVGSGAVGAVTRHLQRRFRDLTLATRGDP